MPAPAAARDLDHRLGRVADKVRHPAFQPMGGLCRAEHDVVEGAGVTRRLAPHALNPGIALPARRAAMAWHEVDVGERHATPLEPCGHSREGRAGEAGALIRDRDLGVGGGQKGGGEVRLGRDLAPIRVSDRPQRKRQGDLGQGGSHHRGKHCADAADSDHARDPGREAAGGREIGLRIDAVMGKALRLLDRDRGG
jgi:hypothetical protein